MLTQLERTEIAYELAEIEQRFDKLTVDSRLVINDCIMAMRAKVKEYYDALHEDEYTYEGEKDAPKIMITHWVKYGMLSSYKSEVTKERIKELKEGIQQGNFFLITPAKVQYALLCEYDYIVNAHKFFDSGAIEQCLGDYYVLAKGTPYLFPTCLVPIYCTEEVRDGKIISKSERLMFSFYSHFTERAFPVDIANNGYKVLDNVC